MRLHVVIQCVPHLARFEALRQRQGNHLTGGVDAGIGAAGGGGGDRSAIVKVRGGGLDHILNRQSRILALPTDERAAVVFQQQSPFDRGVRIQGECPV